MSPKTLIRRVTHDDGLQPSSQRYNPGLEITALMPTNSLIMISFLVFNEYDSVRMIPTDGSI